MYVNEKFVSISGEVGCCLQGTLSAFIRFSGCNLSCRWCDAVNAQNGEGEEISVDDLTAWVCQQGVPHVVLTGGEPLLQSDMFYLLLHELVDIGFFVTVETNGTLLIRDLSSLPVLEKAEKENRLCWVVDYKLPGSGMQEKMLPLSVFIDNIRPFGFVKFGVQDMFDFQFMSMVIVELEEGRKIRGCPATGFKYAISPIDPEEGQGGILCQKFISHSLFRRDIPIVFNFQIHKFLEAR